MREAGRLVAQALELVASMIKPGVATQELNKAVEDFFRRKEGIPVFKNYRGFPASICTSVNEEVVHGIPGPRKLRQGDIVSVDIGVKYKGYVGDSAKTFPVGEIDSIIKKLLTTCEECLYHGIEAARPKARISNISSAIQKHAENNGFSVVREYTGHGVGTRMHEEPQVPNYVDNSWLSLDKVLQPGYCLAIEPMVNVGTYHTETIRRQNWEVVVTQDRQFSAHFEHSIAITENGPQILTLL